MEDAAWQPFARLIARGDVEGVVAALEAMDETERRRLSKRARAEARADEQRNDDGWVSGLTDAWRMARDRTGAVQALAFGTGGPAAAARSWWMPFELTALERLVRCRPREWRQEWAERILDEREVSTLEWPVVYRMVKDGLIDRPDSPGYVSGAVTGLRDPHDAPARRPLAETLRAEPDWLRYELWRIFDVEDVSLTSWESYLFEGAQTWLEALCELAADGTVPRDRLLDASLAALRRDFSAHNARWYHKLHEALEPTPDEHAARLDELLALLAAEDPAVVAFALRALGKLERAGRLPADRFFEALAPALHVAVKGHATRAAKLAGGVLKRAPDAAPVALPLLADALAHDAREVQEALVVILERHRDAIGDEVRAQLSELAGEVDPALRARVAELGGGPAPFDDLAVGAGPAVALPPVRVLAPDAPRLAGREALVPVAGLDELLERAAVMLERDDDPDELELVLDGISRLRAERVAPGRARALVSRATDVAGPWDRVISFDHSGDALGAVLLRWLAPADGVSLARTGEGPREALALRVRELAGDLRKGAPRALLSTPTHAGGWIDPAVAVRRVEELGGRRPPVMELAQMVLRLAPDGRAAAREAAAALTGEAAGVLVRALGGEARRPLLTRLKPAWDAAEHARDPSACVVPDHPLDVRDAMGAGFLLRGARKVDLASPADLLVLPESWWGWESGGIERWLTTVWPANREPVFQIAVRRLWMELGMRQYGIGDILEILLEHDEPVGPRATLALALALGSSDVTDRTLAADAAIATLRSRRLDGAGLGAALARLLREQEGAVPSRWASALGDVAATGPLAAHEVQAALEVVVAAATDDDRRRVLGLVELLRRLTIDGDAAVANEHARAWLERLPPRSKGGRAARDVLSVTGDGAARSRAASAELAGESVQL